MGKSKSGIKTGTNMNDFYFHILALIKENNLFEGCHSYNSTLTYFKYTPVKVMFLLIFLYIKENGIDEYISDVYDTPFETGGMGPILPDVTDKFFYFSEEAVFKFANKKEIFNHFNKKALEILDIDYFKLVDICRNTSIYRENWDTVIEQNIKIPISLKMIGDAVLDQK